MPQNIVHKSNKIGQFSPWHFNDEQFLHVNKPKSNLYARIHVKKIKRENI